MYWVKDLLPANWPWDIRFRQKWSVRTAYHITFIHISSILNKYGHVDENMKKIIQQVRM